MTESEKNVELRSEEVEDILGRVPGWITRNGILMLFILVLLLISGAWMFRVPDVKRATIVVTSLRPPAEIEARTDGKIVRLLVEDNGMVNEGQVLAVIENPANYDHVMDLVDLLEKVNVPPSVHTDTDLPVNGNAKLGMIQTDYAIFYKNYRDYQDFIRLDYHQRKIKLLQEEYEKYRAYSGSLENRASILKEEYALSVKQFLRDSTLFLAGVVSESDYEKARSDMLTSRAGWQEMVSLKAENEIRIAGILEEILEMELKEQEKLSLLASSLGESLNRLKASIDAWEKRYLIVAPVAGQVTFNQFWCENQNVKSGDKVMTIVPGDTGQLIGKISLPVIGAGEVKEGNQVNIRFDNYPYLEYGMVRGMVSNVSKVPQGDFYTVEVELPDGLKTYYGIDIAFSQNMRGQAEVLTDKMRLLQRIFNPVRSAISRQREMTAAGAYRVN